MSSVLSRVLGRKKRTRSCRSRSRSALLKELQAAGKRKREARNVKGFAKWCRGVGIELHPQVSEELHSGVGVDPPCE